MSDPDAPEAGEPGESKQSLSEVLASIRALVSAETAARLDTPQEEAGAVLMLTEEMRVSPPARSGELLAEGIDVMPRPGGAPILDEEALRGMINAIVREELQGELGERISRNLHKLVRREVVQALDERKLAPEMGDD